METGAQAVGLFTELVGPEQRPDCRSFAQDVVAPFRDWHRMVARRPSVVPDVCTP